MSYIRFIFQTDNDDQLIAAIDAALEIGYRHIDTAFAYNNEGIIGKALNKWFSSGKLSSKLHTSP